MFVFSSQAWLLCYTSSFTCLLYVIYSSLMSIKQFIQVWYLHLFSIGASTFSMALTMDKYTTLFNDEKLFYGGLAV